DRQVADDEPGTGVEEVVHAVEEAVRAGAAGAEDECRHVRVIEAVFRRGSPRRTRARRTLEARTPRTRRRSAADQITPWYVSETAGEIGEEIKRAGDEDGAAEPERELARGARVVRALDALEERPGEVGELGRAQRTRARGAG